MHALSRPARLIAALFLLAGSAGAHAAPRCDFPGRAVPLAFGDARNATFGGQECRGQDDVFASPAAHEGALYRIQLPATTAFEVKMTSDDFPPEIKLFDANGKVITNYEARWDFPNLPKQREATLPVTMPAGTYYIAAEKGFSYPGMATGTGYRIALRKLDVPVVAGDGGECEERRDAARHKPLALDGAATDGALGVADCFEYGTYSHYIPLTIPTRRTIELKAESTAFEPSIDLIDAAGAFLQDEDDQEKAKSAIRAEVPAGKYIVRIHSETLSKFIGGKYRLAARTVGTPSADASQNGAVCEARPQPLDLGKGKTTVVGLLTEASCKRSDGVTYHTYAFTASRPQRLTMWDGSVEFQINGPNGPVAREDKDLWHGKVFDQMLPAGRYTVTFSHKASSYNNNRNVGRFKVDMELRDAMAGEDGDSCSKEDMQPVAIGQAKRGSMTTTSCALSLGSNRLPAELYTLDLAAPREVQVELTPDGSFEPLLAMTTGRKWEAGEPKSGRGVRRMKVSLPAGQHTIAVFSATVGTFTLSVK